MSSDVTPNVDGAGDDFARSRLGPYRLLRQIGQGGQGAVYLAEDSRLRRRVAIKVVTRLAAATPRTIERFRREAETASRLDHPGICPVYDTGIEDGVPYLVMRYVEGTTLAERLAAPDSGGASLATLRLDGPATPSASPRTNAESALGGTGIAVTSTRADLFAALELVERAAHALHYAHEHGVIHRDIKPGNMMVTDDGQVVILDFGLARDVETESATLTHTGEAFGTPAYMAPEQIQARPDLDRRVDVWALGVTLYEMLAGTRPFVAPTRDALYRKILSEEPEDPRRRHRGIGRDLWIVVQTALAKDRDRRYQTADDLARDLAAIRTDRPIAAKPVGPLGRVVRWAKRAPAAAALVALLSVGLPILAGVATWAVPRLSLARELDRQARIDEELASAFALVLDERNAEAEAKLEALLAKEPTVAEAVATLAFSALRQRDLSPVPGLEARHPRAFAAEPGLRRMMAAVRRLRGEDELAARIEAELPEAASALDHFVLAMLGRPAPAQDQPADAAAGPQDSLSASRHAEQAVLRSTVRRPLYHLLWVTAASEDHDVSATLAATASALYHWPDDPRVAYVCGRALGDVGRTEDAVRETARAVRLRPNDAIARNDHAVFLWRAGRIDEALETARQAAALDPSYAVARSTIGSILRDKKQLDLALPELRAAVEINPDYAEGHANLAGALFEANLLPEAEAAWRAAVTLRPGNLRYVNNLGATQMRQGRTAEAAESYRAAVALAPKSPDALLNLGGALATEGRAEEAVPVLESAVALAPEHPEALCNLGRTYLEVGRYAEALELVKRGHEIGSRRPGWRYPSSEWVAEAEQYLRDLAVLPSVIEGERTPRTAREASRFAEIASRTGRLADGVDLYRTAIGLNSKPSFTLFSAAARTAARAAREPGAAAAEFRTQALAWLQEAVAVLSSPAVDKARAKTVATRWLADPVFAALREEAGPGAGPILDAIASLAKTSPGP